MSSTKKLPEDPNERLRVLQESFYMTLGNFFSGGTYDNILLGQLEGLNKNLQKTNSAIENLNKSIENADKSSSNLASALNRITFVGVVIAVLSLGLEYYKFFVSGG